MRKSLKYIKIAIAIAMVAYLFHAKIITIAPLRGLLAAPESAGLAILLIFFTIPIGAWRWFLLLRSQDIHIRLASVYHISIIGNFANIFMPGAAGGDAIRMLYVLQEAGKGLRAAATMSVVVDRLTGLLGLVIVALGAVGLRLMQGYAATDLVAMTIILGVVLVASVIGGTFGVVFCHWFNGHALAAKLAERGRIGTLLISFIQAIGSYRGQIGTLVSVISLAAVTHLLVVAAVVVVAMAMMAGPLSPADYAVATPLALAANIIPLTPGGAGIGEGVFGQMCKLLDPSDNTGYGSVFFAFRVLSTFAVLPGALSLIFYKRRAIPVVS